MVGRLWRTIAFAAAAASATGAAAAAESRPLFAADVPIRLTLTGPLGAIARDAERSTSAHEAVLTLAGDSPETHAVRVSARGLSRRRPGLCGFPPLWVEFAARPAAESLFRGQRRLKLVTHCRSGDSFQPFVLLEYAAYRLYNAWTPRSLRVRLAEIDYRETGASKPFLTRLGFFIEDIDEAARRNGLVEIDSGNISARRLSAPDAARVALFQYMIGNLDWSTRSGPPGDRCCHNARLLGPTKGATAGLVPVPYDFDFSGLVDAPYAGPPPEVRVRSVRIRRYLGFCIHNAEAPAAFAGALAARTATMAALEAVPRLDERSRRRAASYVEGFFDELESPAKAARMLETCLD